MKGSRPKETWNSNELGWGKVCRRQSFFQHFREQDVELEFNEESPTWRRRRQVEVESKQRSLTNKVQIGDKRSNQQPKHAAVSYKIGGMLQMKRVWEYDSDICNGTVVNHGEADGADGEQTALRRDMWIMCRGSFAYREDQKNVPYKKKRGYSYNNS